MLTLFASEISACAGFHKYKKQWEVLRDIFQRHHHGKTYQSAVERLEATQHIHVADLEEKKTRMLGEFGTEPIKCLTETEVTNSVQLNQLIETFETQIREKEHQFVNTRKELKTRLDEVEEKIQVLKDEQEKINQTLDPFSDYVPSSTIEQAKYHLKKQQEESKTLKDQLDKVSRDWNDFKEVKKTLISEKVTQFGKKKESEVVESGILGEISNNNAETFRQLMGTEPCDWGIVGKVDGFKDGKLIEIKNRKSKIYDPLPEYDYIQVQVYLQILDREEALVIQCLTDPYGDIQSVEQSITRDREFWQNTVYPYLEKFVHMTCRLLNDTSCQDEFLVTADGRKTFLVNRWLKEVDQSPLKKKTMTKKTASRKKPTVKKTMTKKTVSRKTIEKLRVPQKLDKPNEPNEPNEADEPNEPNEPYTYNIDLDLQTYMDHEKTMMNVQIKDLVPPTWQSLVSGFDWNSAQEWLNDQCTKAPVLPPRELIFRALSYFSPEQTRVVILGQDPYPTVGEAQGLAFSVSSEVNTVPPSLRNIYQELKEDVGKVRQSGDLQDWAKQGVLLLNRTLTTKSNRSNSHAGQWSNLTNSIIENLSKNNEHMVFILWGKNAQEVEVLIDQNKHTLIVSAHPSPLSARTGFFGSRPFSRCNQALESHGQNPIQW